MPKRNTKQRPHLDAAKKLNAARNIDPILSNIRISRQVGTLAPSVNEVLDELIKHNNAINRAILEWNRGIVNQVTSNIQASIDSIVSQGTRSIVERRFAEASVRFYQFSKSLEQAELDAENIAPAFQRAGIWLPSAMPLTFWLKIHGLYVEGKLTPDLIVDSFVEFFHGDGHIELKAMVNTWWDSSIYEHRKRFIEDALEAHENKKYTLSVPTLLLSIEGIMKEILEIDEDLDELVGQINEKLPQDTLSPVHKDALSASLKTLSKSRRKKKQIVLKHSRGLCRHDILHGKDVNYDTPLNSLRAFLILDELYSLANPVDQLN